jgi:glucose/arabinose dehydrogenase
VTIPRHLRDIVITEYGVADLRGQSRQRGVKRLIAIADSRFQDELVREAKATASWRPAGAARALPPQPAAGAGRQAAPLDRGRPAAGLPVRHRPDRRRAAHRARAEALKHATQHPVELVTMAVRSLWDGKEARTPTWSAWAWTRRTASRPVHPQAVRRQPVADFATDPWVYFTFSEDGTGGSGTALARGRLAGNTLQNVSVLWRQTPKVSGGNHYGSRIAFRPDGTLYVTAGDRAQDDPAAPGTQWAQNVARTQGKVVRLNRDGSVPTDNPSFGIGALPGLWSRGHRNPQGAAVRPGTSDLWLTEHGPQGGDEVNRVLAGRNYGWPLVSYGCPYGSPVGDACRVGGGTHAPTYEEPKSIWVPTSIAPGGIAFYTGAGFPEWQGHLFVTALAGQTLWRLVVDANDNVTLREEVAAAKALNRRIRHVRQGPDGWLYLLTDDGRIVRLAR